MAVLKVVSRCCRLIDERCEIEVQSYKDKLMERIGI